MKTTKNLTHKFPICYVEFLDYNSKSEWISKDELDKSVATKVFLVGWLVGEDKTLYKFAEEVTEDGDFGDTMCVLKKSVLKFKKLRVRL